MSLPKIYLNRNLPADQLRKQNVLSLSQAPQLMLQPTLSGNLPCEFLSLETIHRWILCEWALVRHAPNTVSIQWVRSTVKISVILMYRITGKCGRSLNLAIWRIWPLIAKLKAFRWMQRQCCSSHAWDAKLKSTNYVQMTHSPNFPVIRFMLLLSWSVFA